VVHVHGIWSYPNAAAARAAERAGVPYIVRPAGMLSDYCLRLKAFKKWLYWAAVEGRTVRRAAGFHCTGGDEEADARRVRPDARTFLIPQGMDLPDVPPAPNALAVRCGPVAAGRPVVLFLGRLHPVKGITDLLLPAFARVADGPVLAIAGGPDAAAPGYERLVREEIARLGLANRVVLLGPVAAADRWALFDGAAAFVLPSHSENFGMVVAEAMARGCPVVVTEGVQSKAQVLAAGAGRVVPFEPETLATALVELLCNPSTARAMGEAGRRYVHSELTWDRVAVRVHAMYRAVAG
jgi:glycosyltransferase involved in cell wall biosynthesis